MRLFAQHALESFLSSFVRMFRVGALPAQKFRAISVACYLPEIFLCNPFALFPEHFFNVSLNSRPVATRLVLVIFSLRSLTATLRRSLRLSSCARPPSA